MFRIMLGGWLDLLCTYRGVVAAFENGLNLPVVRSSQHLGSWLFSCLPQWYFFLKSSLPFGGSGLSLRGRRHGKGRCQFQVFSWAVTGGSNQLIHMSPLHRNFPWLRQRECWNSSSAMGFHCWKAVNAWRVWLFGDHRGRCSRSWTQSQGHVEVDLLLLRDRIPQHRS